LWLFCFALEMAEEETSDTPSRTESPRTVLGESPLPALNEAPPEVLIGSFTEALTEALIEHADEEATGAQPSLELGLDNQVASISTETSDAKDDDDVLFVFSVPRRRRKKRKR
jgi:hypothetical protein